MTNRRPCVDVFIQVRLDSSRLPGKALAHLGSAPCLDHVIAQCQAAVSCRHVVVCTSTRPIDDPIAKRAGVLGAAVYRGHHTDCLTRFAACATQFDTDIIVRVCGDSPLLSPRFIDSVVHELLRTRSDYIRTVRVPIGTYVEAFTFGALDRALRCAVDHARSDDVTHFVGRSEINRIGTWTPHHRFQRPDLVLALNRPQDLAVLRKVFNSLPAPSLEAAIAWLDRHPDVRDMNSGYEPVPTRCDVRLDTTRRGRRPPEPSWYRKAISLDDTGGDSRGS